MAGFPKISSLKTADKFVAHLSESAINLPFMEEVPHGDLNPFGRTYECEHGTIGNRFAILPMEGWDGTKEGKATELTINRWRNFGLSGAKLIWGGEAVAVRHDGRANPNQLLINESNLSDLEHLRSTLFETHEREFGNADDLLVGLQLTHSGRFARPDDKRELKPRTIYVHPILDRRFNVDSNNAVLSDDELKILIDDFIAAAAMAWRAGFTWVDIKHCHGYLGHELLSAYDREGEFGGSFENRTRFLRDVVSGIRSAVPQMKFGVRLSIFDFAPFEPDPDNEGQGRSSVTGDYGAAWGGDGTGTGIDLAEPFRYLQLMKSIGVNMLCTTAGSPYYVPHIQRPATFPPSDGYRPPEDPLVGVARQIEATHLLKREHPDLLIVGSGYSYLQEWLPNVGAAAIDQGKVDFVGLGRMVLSYPDMPADILAGKTLARKRICRTFSDCTTAPRNGLISGCFPLDAFYKKRPEAEQLKSIKRSVR